MKKALLTTLICMLIQCLQAQEWESLHQAGTKAFKSNDYNAALNFWEKAKEKAIIAFGKKHANYVLACNSLAKVYEKQLIFDKASLWYAEAKNTLEVTQGEETSDYAEACYNLGKIYNKQGLYAQAEPLLIKSRDIRAKVLGKTHIDYFKSCNSLASLYEDLGSFDEAESVAEEAKSIIEKLKGKEHHDYADVCNTLGLIYFRKGAYHKAEPLYREAQNIFLKTYGKEHEDYAKTSYNLAKVFRKKGLFNQAEALFLESKIIREKTLGKSHPKYAQSCDNLAGLYRIEGFFDKAEPLFLEAKNIREEVLGKSHPNYATSCQNLALLYQDLKRFDKAEALMKESKQVRENILGKSHPSYATSCHNLARLYEVQAKFVEAEQMHLEAKNVREKSLGKLHPDYGKSCFSVAKLYEKQGFYSKAEPLLVEAIEIFKQTLGNTHPDYAEYINQLGDLYEKQDMIAKAIPLYLEASKGFISQTENNFAHLSEKEKGLFYATFNTYFEHYNSFVLKCQKDFTQLTAWIYHNALITKALLFNATNKMRGRIRKSNDEQLIQLYSIWKSKKEYLTKAYQMTDDEKEEETDIKKMEDEINQIEKELSQRSAFFAQENEKIQYEWTDIQKQLKKNEAAIEIIRTRFYDKKWTDSVLYIALIVRPQTKGQPEMVVLGNGKELEGKYLRSYQSGIKFQRNDKYSYLQYWERIAQKIPNTQKVFISLDGVYNSINLNTLFNPKTQRFLIDELNIQLVSNTKDLIKFASHRRAIRKNMKAYQAHLFGYPDYAGNPEKKDTAQTNPNNDRALAWNDDKENTGVKLDTTQRFFGFDGKIAVLQGTKTEIININSFLQKQKLNPKIYLEMQANEEAIKSLRNPDILHIATHGFFLTDIPTAEENTEKSETRFFAGLQSKRLIANPLLRCGLLLAGAEFSLSGKIKELNASGSLGAENGILTAQEAMNLDLDNTDLVVLSACETGLGEIKNGEGVYGLQRAFQQAGAKSVLMSLWTVSDESTQEMMSLFYENLVIKQQDKRIAFQNAQKTLKAKYPQPYYWGAFVMVGE